jgi:hypothetical protein
MWATDRTDPNFSATKSANVTRPISFRLAVMTISSAPFRHDGVFLQEHWVPLNSRW